MRCGQSRPPVRWPFLRPCCACQRRAPTQLPKHACMASVPQAMTPNYPGAQSRPRRACPLKGPFLLTLPTMVKTRRGAVLRSISVAFFVTTFDGFLLYRSSPIDQLVPVVPFRGRGLGLTWLLCITNFRRRCVRYCPVSRGSA